MRIESLKIKNFRALQDVRIENIPPMSVFVGANGSGKTTLFDVFGFLKDSLTHNVTAALARRGGFREVVSRDSDGPIEIELKFRQSKDERKAEDNSTKRKRKPPLVTYSLEIGELEGKAIIQREELKYRRGSHGQPWRFLDFKNGKGKAIKNEEELGKDDAKIVREDQELDAPDILAIKGLGQFQRFKAVSDFRRMIENWHVSDFHISSARLVQDAGYDEHLSENGENLSNVAKYMRDHHGELFKQVLETMARRVPGIEKVEPVVTEDGRLVLKFQDGSFKDPFISRYVSDGTIKMFAYLLLLHDPKPHPILCVEEPENQLYPHLMEELAEEFRAYTEKGGQIFVSTHSPDFLNGVHIDEVFWLSKKEGFTHVQRANAEELLVRLTREGDKPGWLWKEGLFQGASP